MSLTAQQRHDLYSLAKEHWLKAESTLYAYERAFQRDRRISNRLKLATVVAALLTAASTALPFAWFTVLVGVLTAALAAIEQQYAPATSSQKYWECCGELEAVKRNLSTAAITFSEVQELSAGATPLIQAGQKITDVTRLPAETDDSDKRRALQAFAATVIAVLIDRANDEIGTVTQESGELLELAEDAPNIVPAYRTRSISG